MLVTFCQSGESVMGSPAAGATTTSSSCSPYETLPVGSSSMSDMGSSTLLGSGFMARQFFGDRWRTGDSGAFLLVDDWI